MNKYAYVLVKRSCDCLLPQVSIGWAQFEARGLEIPLMQPKQDNLSRPKARQGSVKRAGGGAKYIKMVWLNWEVAFVHSHHFSCLKHGCENGWSFRNQENESHLGCNPSEAVMETRIWVQVIWAVIQGSTGRGSRSKTEKGEKLIKDELLFWVSRAQCSWELHYRIHFRIICFFPHLPPPTLPGERELDYLFTIAWEILLEFGGMSLSGIVAGPLSWWADFNG